MKPELLKCVIEAAVMATSQPIGIAQLVNLFENDPEPPDRDQIRAALDQLQQEYANRGIELKEVASGFRFQIKPDCAGWVNRLFEEKPQRYSRALLETLAIIAYRQPITRGEIEDIRGVNVSANIVKTLQEREWVRVVGHRDVPGKPELLATTKQFLDYFNLKRLSDLPSLAEIKDFDQLNPDLFEGLEHAPAANAGQAEAGEITQTEIIEESTQMNVSAADIGHELAEQTDNEIQAAGHGRDDEDDDYDEDEDEDGEEDYEDEDDEEWDDEDDDYEDEDGDEEEWDDEDDYDDEDGVEEDEDEDYGDDDRDVDDKAQAEQDEADIAQVDNAARFSD